MCCSATSEYDLLISSSDIGVSDPTSLASKTACLLLEARVDTGVIYSLSDNRWIFESLTVDDRGGRAGLEKLWHRAMVGVSDPVPEAIAPISNVGDSRMLSSRIRSVDFLALVISHSRGNRGVCGYRNVLYR